MLLRFIVEAEVEREEGLFASRDELEEQIVGELEGADPGSLDGDEGGSYTVVSFEVTAEAPERGKTAMWVTPAERKLLMERRASRARRVS